MSISSETRKAGPFTGNGVTTAFPFAFKVFTEGDVRVVRTSLLGIESDLVLNSDYTVSLNGNQDANPGGTVTLSAALADDLLLTLTSKVQNLQPLALTNAGGFFPAVLNTAFDRAVILVQQLSEGLGRSLKVQISSEVSPTLPAPEANSVLAWNDTATGFTNVPAADLATVGAFGDSRVETFSGNGTETDFELDFHPGTVANADVSIDGVVQVAGIDFTRVGQTLVFTTAPPASSVIAVRYARPLAPGPDVESLLAAADAAEADAVATAADRVQTGLDRVATAADVVAAEADRVATAADRVQTGLDRVATAADRVATAADRVATAADAATVTGLIRTDADRNLSAGAGAGLAITTAEEAALFGVGAGEDLTTGIRNAAFGEVAASSLTTGSNNTALGRASLVNLTTGDENVAAGSAAGASLTGAAARNTFVGTDAGFNALQKVDAVSSTGIGRGAYTTADNQVVIGDSAVTETILQGTLRVGHGGPELFRADAADANYFFGDAGPASLPTGTDNLAIGAGAGDSLTTATENVLVGIITGQFITTGIRNAALGEGSLSSLTTGSNNTAAGRAALINLTTGGENVGSGSAAGASLTTGGRNTFIGADAGFNGSQKVDAVSSIGLGRASYTTKDYQAALGSSEITETVLFGTLLIGHGGPELARLDGPNENYFIGDAGPATLPTGGGNVAFGKDAGNALTTCVASVFIGKDAGKAVTTGVDHTFVGAGAGIAQVSGVGCTALGRLAGKTSVSATNWTALGDTALEFNVSNSAVGVGYGCGRDHTSGTGFCGVGSYAGGYGNANRTTVMGTEALGAVANVDYGDDNSVFGYRGMGSATGSNNAGLGAEVFINLTTGSYNTGVGRQAGARLTTGTYCTFLGYNAGQPAGQKVDAVNSTALGANAVATKSNQMVLGDSNIVETLLRGQVILGAETTNSTAKADIISVKSSIANPAGAQLVLSDTTPQQAGCGGQLVFRGVYNSGGAITEAAAVQAQKTNGTDGNFGFDLTFHTRVNGGSNTEKLRVTTDGVLKQITFTVATLPAASVGAGSRAFVTDANATTFASIVAGGGANGVPVYSDGTNWRIG